MVAVPFVRYALRENRVDPNLLAKKITHLIMEGIALASVDELINILKDYPQNRRLTRCIMNLEIIGENRPLWDDISAEVQYFSNRKMRNRLPVSAIAVALNKYYGVVFDNSLSCGVISVRTVNIITEILLKESGRQDSNLLPLANVAFDMKDNPKAEKSSMTVEATYISFEESRSIYPRNSPPPKPTRPLTLKEGRRKFSELSKLMDRLIS